MRLDTSEERAVQHWVSQHLGSLDEAEGANDDGTLEQYVMVLLRKGDGGDVHQLDDDDFE